MKQVPELVMDVTALVGNPISGIQRVIMELVPRLAKLAREKGASTALAHSLGHRLHVIQRWDTPVSEAAIRERLLQIQNCMSIWRGGSLGEPILGLVSFLAPRTITRRFTSPEFRRWFREFARTKLNFGGLSVKPKSKLLAFSGGISPLRIPSEIARRDVVVVIHDLIPAWNREYVSAEAGKEFIERLLPLVLPGQGTESVRFVTPTQSAREDFLEFCWGLARSRPEVTGVHWGFNREQFFPDKDGKLRETLGIPANGFLVLAVSSHDPRKRFETIEKAIRDLADELPIYGIFTGIAPHSRTTHPRIRFLGHVADDRLRQLYSTCDAYVNWSAAEGFGLPVIEALACGSRVVVPRDTAALREVGGRHVLFPERTSVSGLIDLLRDLHQFPRLNPEMPDLGEFNWERSAHSIDERLWLPDASADVDLLWEAA